MPHILARLAHFGPGTGKAKLVKGGKTAGKSLQEPISPSLLFLTRRMGIRTVRSSPSSPYCALFQGPDLHPLRRSPSRSRVTYFSADTRQQQQLSRKAHSGNISHQQLPIPEFVYHRFNYKVFYRAVYTVFVNLGKVISGPVIGIISDW